MTETNAEKIRRLERENQAAGEALERLSSVHEDAARGRKVLAMVVALYKEGVPLEKVRAFDQAQWEIVARHAGAKPPSPTTVAMVQELLGVTKRTKPKHAVAEPTLIRVDNDGNHKVQTTAIRTACGRDLNRQRMHFVVVIDDESQARVTCQNCKHAMHGYGGEHWSKRRAMAGYHYESPE